MLNPGVKQYKELETVRLLTGIVNFRLRLALHKVINATVVLFFSGLSELESGLYS